MHNRSLTVSIVTGAIAMAAAAGTCYATDVQIRDAPGGVNSLGNPGGLFLAPTGNRMFARTEVAPSFKDFAVGTFGFERRAAGSDGPWEAFSTYCFEPDVGISFAAHPDNLVGVTYKQAAVVAQPGINAAEATQLEILWKNAFADSLTSAVKAAAFQAIVWELGSTDGTYNLAAGNFQIAVGGTGTINEADVKAQADAWHANIGTVWTEGTPLDILINPSSQNLIVERPPDTIIPLPTAGAMAAFGLIGLAGRRRRTMA